MAKYLIRALRQLKVGDSLRMPGELVPEAAEWPNLRHYENLQWVERIPVYEDHPEAVEYPPVAPSSKLAEVLEPEREPTSVVVAGKSRTGASVPIRCVNCRKRNWLPTDFLETRKWMCHFCAQPQTTVEARDHPAPTSPAEYAESIDARYVNEEGDLLPGRFERPTGSEDLTAAWSPGAGARS